MQNLQNPYSETLFSYDKRQQETAAERVKRMAEKQAKGYGYQMQMCLGLEDCATCHADFS